MIIKEVHTLKVEQHLPSLTLLCVCFRDVTKGFSFMLQVGQGALHVSSISHSCCHRHCQLTRGVELTEWGFWAHSVLYHTVVKNMFVSARQCLFRAHCVWQLITNITLEEGHTWSWADSWWYTVGWGGIWLQLHSFPWWDLLLKL